MDSFSKVEESDRSFNVAFSTVVSIVIAVFLTGLVTFLGLYTLPFAWFIYAIIILSPVVTFGIAESQGAEYKMAYYKKWADSILSVLDRKKILKDFTQKYNIRSYRTKVSDIKADGRWHFKVSTDHVRNLIVKRDEILSHLEMDKIQGEAQLNEEIESNELVLDNEKTKRDAQEKEVQILARLLGDAKTTKEIFMQRRDYEIAVKKLNEIKIRINEAQRQVNISKDKKDKLKQKIENAVERAKEYYYLRYQNYTSSAIKEINAINGLKYKIEDMGDGK